jgi:hypothetical protein
MSKRALLIGLVGEIGHGKSSVAQALMDVPKNLDPGGFFRQSFASPLKSTCAKLCTELGVPELAFYGSQAQKAEPQPALGGASGRDLLMRVGTDGFRAAYPRFWVDLSIKRAESFLEAGHSVVFDDVRFLDEAAAIRKAGGVVWRVVKTDTDPALFRLFKRVRRAFRREHPSETEPRRIVADATIEAAPGAMEELQRATRAELAALLTRSHYPHEKTR